MPCIWKCENRPKQPEILAGQRSFCGDKITYTKHPIFTKDTVFDSIEHLRTFLVKKWLKNFPWILYVIDYKPKVWGPRSGFQRIG